MFAIIVIILVVAIVALELKSSSTANLSTSNPSTPDTTTYQNDNSLPVQAIANTDFSPIDIGGLSMNVPNAVMQWQDLANKYAQINSILDPEEILAIIWNESTGNPTKENPGDPSWGLMGVELPVGEMYADVTDSSQLLDPETNIKAGSGFLAHLKNKFSVSFPDTWSDGYNEGETKLAKGIILTPGYSQAFNSHLNALKGLG